MKIRVVRSKDEITDLSPNETMVHFTFRPSGIDLMMLIKICPKMRAIQLPSCYYKNLSKSTRSIFDIQGVELIEGDVWGNRKDIDEYYVIDERMLEEIVDLMSSGKNIDEVVSTIKNKTKLSAEMIKYIAKQKMVI
jgi:hypothetical protein